MYGFEVIWQTREQLPTVPQDMLFSGTQRIAPGNEGAPRIMTPVIEWGQSRAYVFDDRVHHQQAWLVVFGDGVHMTGAYRLQDFRHITDIQQAPSGVAWYLLDGSAKRVEISHQQLDDLDGKARRESELEGLPVDIPFCLSNGHEVLVADEQGVRVAAGSDALASQWTFSGGRLTHVATRQVLGMGIRGVSSARNTDRWHLSPQGSLMYGDGQHRLCADPSSGEVWLQPRDEGATDTRWHVKRPSTRSKAASLVVVKLVIHVQVASDFRAGTGDDVYFSINGSAQHQWLAGDFERGSSLQVTVELDKLFAGRVLFADDIDSIELYQVSKDGYGPSWRMSSLDLVVNDEISNRVLGSDSPWLLPGNGACWTGKVNWLDWRHEHGETPLDFAGYTYPVQWQPLLADWLYWRSYEPRSIAGVCQLIGEHRGRILAYELQSQSPVYLKPNGEDDAYTWVYTPQGSIIVKWWDKAAPRNAYTRHSQLASGSAVVCAGEMTLTRVSSRMAVQDLLGMINDASGHYLPDGGACLAHVRDRLEQLGLDTRETAIHFKQPLPVA